MDDRVLMAHGSGGNLMHDLIKKSFVATLSNPILDKLDDSAVFELSSGGRLAFTTDSYVVSPIFFPGGDIGKLAVCGTVNDLSMSGAIPLYLSLSFIIEEGLLIADLEKIVNSIHQATAEAGVKIVAGDTKVVDKGSADKLFINTSGVGIVPSGVDVSGANARPGNKINGCRWNLHLTKRFIHEEIFRNVSDNRDFILTLPSDVIYNLAQLWTHFDKAGRLNNDEDLAEHGAYWFDYLRGLCTHFDCRKNGKLYMDVYKPWETLVLQYHPELSETRRLAGNS